MGILTPSLLLLPTAEVAPGPWHSPLSRWAEDSAGVGLAAGPAGKGLTPS